MKGQLRNHSLKSPISLKKYNIDLANGLRECDRSGCADGRMTSARQASLELSRSNPDKIHNIFSTIIVNHGYFVPLMLFDCLHHVWKNIFTNNNIWNEQFHRRMLIFDENVIANYTSLAMRQAVFGWGELRGVGFSCMAYFSLYLLTFWLIIIFKTCIDHVSIDLHSNLGLTSSFERISVDLLCSAAFTVCFGATICNM